MKNLRITRLFQSCADLILVPVICLTGGMNLVNAAAEPSGATQVRSLLNSHCIECHGPDESARKADLRLDSRDAMVRPSEGEPVILPGNAARSPLFQRIISSDPDERMPPPDHGLALDAGQIAIIRSWIEAGAELPTHWAWVAPDTGHISRHLENLRGSTNLQDASPVDILVSKRLADAGLALQPQETPARLIRRLSLDLTGLPPDPAHVEDFENNPGESNYLKWVDYYLNAPSFGERWAAKWLDLARFADTKGFEKDLRRTIWRFRDWVIDAYNSDLPFDEFTRAQLAGDLIDAESDKYLLATAFHRNTMTNDEGGTDDEEWRIMAVRDRVDTTFQVWMGLTAGCAKCHSHKYDPISIEEYYGLFAFFDQTQDSDRFDDSPKRPFPTRSQSEEEKLLRNSLTALTQKLESHKRANRSQFDDWSAQSLKALAIAGIEPGKSPAPEPAVVSPWELPTPLPSGAAPTSGWKDGMNVKVPAEIIDGSTITIQRSISVNSIRKIRFSLKSTHPVEVTQDGLRMTPVSVIDGLHQFDITLAPGDIRLALTLKNATSDSPPEFQFEVIEELVTGLPVEVAAELAVSPPASDLPLSLEWYWKSMDSVARNLAHDINVAQKRLLDHQKTYPQTPVLLELPTEKKRTTRIHRRGNFLDQGREVMPGTPSAFHPFRSDWERNRLGLAEWIVSRDNPLTARVQVNRVWAQIFGRGLVETEEDFGTQGIPPSHPHLLDWLSLDFMENGWSIKHLCRTLVTSRTYRQAAAADAQVLNTDPGNRLLSRGARFRLSGEAIRDSALQAAGLLSTEIGGPSSFPYQPDGIWKTVYSQDRWTTSPGDGKWRRGLYTFIRRTSPYPAMLTFDGSSRESCQIRRIRSNTPLQALVTLNDPVYIEAAQSLALMVTRESGDNVDNGIELMFRRAISRKPTSRETAILRELYRQRLATYESDDAAAIAMTRSPSGIQLAESDVASLAAWANLANVVLNLDEFLTKP